MSYKVSTIDLRHRIEFLDNIEKDDLIQKWQLRFSTFAKATHLMPNSLKFFEGIEFGNLINQNYMLFCIRFNKEVNKNMRIKLNNKEFLIKKITNILEQDRFLELIAMEI